MRNAQQSVKRNSLFDQMRVTRVVYVIKSCGEDDIC